MNISDVQVRILIEGRLQGMNFRLQTQNQANKLKLGGFVRTLSDGRIEIEARGTQENIDQLLTWCQKEPHSSSIKSILFRYDEPNKSYIDFSIR